VDKARLTPEENRITYDRGDVVEWYVNDTRGLEQGFTLAVPPEELPGWRTSRKETEALWATTSGARKRPSPPTREAGVPERNGTHESLLIAFELTGNLAPHVVADGSAIEFLTPAGVHALRYGKLEVEDASGRNLPARMEAGGERGHMWVHLLVEDQEAVWPLVIDPLVTLGWTAEGDQESATFGISVGTAGDVNGDGYSDVIVGAERYDHGQDDEGRAFLYYGSVSGLELAPAWAAESDQAGAHFGSSVGTGGDVDGDGFFDVIVGADDYTSPAVSEGGAFVYHGSALGLAADPDWTAEGGQAFARFGGAVATAGDVNADGFADVIVGAPRYADPEADEGRAYLFYGSALGLEAAPAWTAEGDLVGAYFGHAVGTAGDANGDGFADVIVGAYGYSSPENNEGRIYVYHGSAGGLGPTADWTDEPDAADQNLGYSVGTAGDVNGDGYADVIVGAPLADAAAGRAYLYRGSAVGLGPAPYRTLPPPVPGAMMGWSVGTAGDVNGDGYSDVIVGLYNYTLDADGEGAAVIYAGSPNGIGLIPSWGQSPGEEDVHYGASVATAGDVNGDGFSDVIVGAPWVDAELLDEGRAYVYLGSAEGPTYVLDWIAQAEGNQAEAQFGFSAGSAGDVNGDGYSDLIVGAPFFDSGEEDEGRAFVYHGSADGPSLAADWTAEGDQANALFGFSVGTAGDVNGDGFSEVIVGAPLFSNPEVGEGRAFVYHGSPAGLALGPSWTVESDQPTALFGISVATAGDVNGDGLSDVIVGAHRYDNPEVDEGRAFAYYGSAAGLEAAPFWTAESDQDGATFGLSVGTAGDVDGDGFSDVIVGAPRLDTAFDDSGGAYVFFGSAGGLALGWSASPGLAEDFFGYSVATAGDVNADGFSDVIVGAPYRDSGAVVDAGSAYVYHGSEFGLPVAEDWREDNDSAGDLFGISVASAGDMNGDAYSDVIVGAITHWWFTAGVARVYLGEGAGLGGDPAWELEPGNFASGDFGYVVAPAGDVNGDNFSDLIVGAPLLDNPELDEGKAYLFYGGGGDGLDLIPRQFRSDGAAMISLLGISDSEDSFRLRLLGRTPAGRGLVRMESEAVPLWFPFNGAAISRTEFMDTGAPGPNGSVLDEFDVSVVGPLVGEPYKWRVRLKRTDPFFPGTRWFSLPYNAPTETDLRIPGVDEDGDGVSVDAGDCDDSDPGVFAIPSPIEIISVEPIMGGYRVTWIDQVPMAGPATVYDAFSGLVSLLGAGGDFSTGSCLVPALSVAWYDALGPDPPPGDAQYLMFRAKNSCGTGGYGTAGRDAGASQSQGPCP
jgi:hypothetical protein